jgi:hypothetical protein
MRKTILGIVALALIWIGYLAWPLHDLLQLARAIERRDIATVRRHVDFHRVRQSFTQQIVEAHLRRTGTRPNPLLQGAAISLADPIVAKLITPETLTELLRIGWPAGVMPDADRPPETIGISVEALGSLWAVFASSDYGINRFEVTVPIALPPDKAFGLRFRIANWRWRLTAIVLPENVRVVLADEIIKSTKPNTPPS